MAIEWKKVKLGETFTVKKGQAITKRESKEGPYPVILGGKEPAYFIDRFNHEGKAIVVSRSGASAGYVSFWNEPIFITDGFLIEPNNDVCYEYIYYLMKNNQARFIGSQKGAAIPHVTPALLSNIDILLPPLETQQKIAGILSAYDDLIENNRKQIKLLEEAAQKLYKEWFVKLNFPGHENIKIVDGMPEGWKILTVEDLIGKLESGSRPKGGIDSTIKKGIASVGAENVIGLGQYNYSSEKFVNKEFYENAKRGKIEDKDILIYKDGAYIGRTSLFQDNFPHKEAMINEHVFLLHAREESNQYFLFFTLYQRTYFEKMQKLNKNAAQPGINQDAIKSLKFLMPAEQLIREFDNFVTPIVKRIFVLAKQNSQLQSARNKLLPRLINGEI